ncbi:hypothetical protein [Flexibacterium corallicola]|uniref:hypothetical protein n=1 Tax=Flexibacterium corallicola TaxID=3037259 RepID=UPI00286F5176|nr:hypothetical protein [Pseudovibrio sp. M1P-2-3]
MAQLRTIFAKGGETPELERQAISNAVSWQEKRVGKLIGSSDDLGGLDIYNAGVPGQMDCIDEAANTTSLLVFLQSKSLLRHHIVERPQTRGYFFDGKYPHATAVVREKMSGQKYVIDSWRLPNGNPPDIMLLTVWSKIKASDLE